MNYHNYIKRYIGTSDIACLTLRSGQEVTNLSFGSPGSYAAYIVDAEAEINPAYKLVYLCCGWMRVFDDDAMIAEFFGKIIEVYRYGSYGCIIKII